MNSTRIRTRTTAKGRTHIVLFDHGDREISAGTFRTLKEARAREDFIRLELAAGRNPLSSLKRESSKTLRAACDDWTRSRIDVAPGTLKTYGFAVKDILAAFGEKTLVEDIDTRMISDWMSRDVSPATARQRLSVLQLILDYADVDPNPARSRKIRKPRAERQLIQPPSAKEVERIIEACSPRFKLPLRLLEQTGMRRSEALALTWGDLDFAENRIRVAKGKSHAARRWASCPSWLMDELAERVPFEDRRPQGKIFPGLTGQGMWLAMNRACKDAGVAHYHPHDLRHRYASVKVREGVPLPVIAEQVGHSSKMFTLDNYAHVVTEDE